MHSQTQRIEIATFSLRSSLEPRYLSSGGLAQVTTISVMGTARVQPLSVRPRMIRRNRLHRTDSCFFYVQYRLKCTPSPPISPEAPVHPSATATPRFQTFSHRRRPRTQLRSIMVKPPLRFGYTATTPTAFPSPHHPPKMDLPAGVHIMKHDCVPLGIRSIRSGCRLSTSNGEEWLFRAGS